MKRKLLIPLVTVLFFTGQAFQQIETGKRIALVVAIAKYGKAGNGWGDLSSMSDDTIITDALKKQGFEDPIKVQNADATVAGIRKGFEALYNKANAGDVVYIHFSSHGQQIWDDNGDELDGYDECIVGYDAPSKYYKGYNGEKHFRDDELGHWVKKIRAKVGPDGDVLVVVDACHSGTALRGPVVRGNLSAMQPPDFNPLKVERKDAGTVDSFMVESTGMAPVVLFSASKAEEPNQEFNGFGSLSLALTHSLNQIKEGDTYRTLFAYIKAEMANMPVQQTPVLEGKVDRTIFSGKEIKQNNYYTVKFVLSDQAVVEGGTMAGLYTGSKVAFMPAGSHEYDAAKAIYTGTVTSADRNKAYVEQNGELSKYEPKQLWLFVLEQSFGNNKLKIASGPGLSGKIRGEVKENMLKLSFVEWNEKDFDLYVDQTNGYFSLHLPDGRQLYDAVIKKEPLNTQLTNYMQGKLMREAKFEDPDMQVELSFTPRHFMGRDDDGAPIILDVDLNKKLVDGNLELVENDVLYLTLTNKGMKDAYINILEINPAGMVEVILPNYAENENAFDFMLPAGKTIVVEDFARRFTGPYFGKYIFKVFATEVPVSFRHIFLTRGAPEKEEYVHPAAQLFQYSYRTRGDNLAVKKTSSGGTTKEYIINLGK